MDDIYIINESKEELESILEGIANVAKLLRIHLNPKKTKIYPIWKCFVFLQFKYYLEENGRVVKRINPKSVHRQRRRLIKYRAKMDKGELPYEDIEQGYKSWMGNYAKEMSKLQIDNMRELYISLFGKDPKWKRRAGQPKQKAKTLWKSAYEFAL